MRTATPFARPMYIMAKPAGAACNLACKYCYYLEKQYLYKDSPQQLMSSGLLEKFISEYMQSVTTPEVLFTWHGGETLIRHLDFYETVMRLEKKYARGRQVANCIQTNGTLLTNNWCQFFHNNGWLVGVSIDGPREYHDAYRKTRGGAGSFGRVMHGIELLNKHRVEWNALAVVNNLNGDHPLEFYRFFKDIHCRFIQFTPIVERIFQHDDGRYLAAVDEGESETVTDFSVTPEQWGNFACAIFDEWVRKDVGEVFVQLFDSTLANWAGVTPGICSLSKSCGHAGAMEWNGDVYSCDHFVFPQYKLGNIYEKSLVEMMFSPRQMAFGQQKIGGLPMQCRQCRYSFACNGECPKNRFCKSANGEPGLNYLCKGYYQFFDHVAPYMDFMKNELDAHRPPSNIMAKIASLSH